MDEDELLFTVQKGEFYIIDNNYTTVTNKNRVEQTKFTDKLSMERKKRKKLSGCQYKKKRLMKLNQERKLDNGIKEYLPSTSKTTGSDLASKNSVPPQSLPNDNIEESQNITPSEVHQEPDTSSSDSQQILNEIPSDPALWNDFCMSSEIRQILVERGPHQIKEFEFPINKRRRRFSPTQYLKVLSNGEVVQRCWLIYSIKNDAVFCFCCMLFDNSSVDWPKKGYSDWGNLIRALTMHENSVNHRNAFGVWKELDIQLKQNKTVDAKNQRIMNMEIQHWSGVLKRIISIIRLLASQSLAFRGTAEELFQPNNGNFLKLVELLSEFDPVMEEHIRRVQPESDKRSVTYLSNNIQDELINLIGNLILSKIVEITKIAKYFSIIADCTLDVGHIEQLSLTIRVVAFDTIQNKYEIKEFFIGFFEASDSTGESLTKLILTHLEKVGFELKWLRGQGYDNGANMKGLRKVQNGILEKYPRAFYVPCACHSLNLVVNDASSRSTETAIFFSIIQELYTYFSGSTERWEVLKKYVSHLTLKPSSVTRWSSSIEALKALRFQLCEVYDALFQIIEDEHRDAETKVKARELAKNIKNYKFICGVILWHDILFEINTISKLLQSETINLSDCVRMLSETTQKLKIYRQSGYDEMKIAADEIALNLECSTEFPAETEVRARKKKRQFDYEAVDEPLTEENKFKINFFNYILDIALNSINERFTLLETHMIFFHFLYDISILKDIDDRTLKNNCASLQSILSVENESDVNANDLQEELRHVSRMLPHSMRPLDVLNFFCQSHLISLYPNTVISLRILLTLPVSVSSGESSFSKLKIIKHYLSSSLSQTKFKNLSLISIESTLAASLDYASLIDEFAKIKVRRVKI